MSCDPRQLQIERKKCLKFVVVSNFYEHTDAIFHSRRRGISTHHILPGKVYVAYVRTLMVASLLKFVFDAPLGLVFFFSGQLCFGFMSLFYIYS